MNKCEYCEAVCIQSVCVVNNITINSYGQKTIMSVEPRICGPVCMRALTRRGLRANLDKELVDLACIAVGLRETYPFIEEFVDKTILFYKSDITRKDYLDFVSEAIEYANASQDEGLLQLFCHTQSFAITLEQLLKKHKVKLPFISTIQSNLV